MNCENCQYFLSEFLDGELEKTVSQDIRAHLSMCAECAEVYEDFASIVGFCGEESLKEIEPPNSQALWCRINNTIETTIQPEIIKQSAPQQTRFQKFWNKTWSMSLTQAVSAVLGIAVISSLLTIVGLKSFVKSDDNFASANVAPSLFDRVLSRTGLVETPQQQREKRLKEQQVAIDYWNQRVVNRRQQWNKNIREAFDRNLVEINQVVYEYTQILEENPQDEITSEMLDSAMSEKMELLREFSEL